MGCDFDASIITAPIKVSIHAPVWGATPVDFSGLCSVLVSIHAPVWGATSYISEAGKILSFNPRTRVGCDSYSKSGIKKKYVSIHAPVWGATWFSAKVSNFCVFQSTHPCGVRLS